MSSVRSAAAGPPTRGATRVHGGPDARGRARWDFSTNANAAGPCPAAAALVREADATRYPDPSYRRLRERLAAWHGVAPARILVAASASEFIQRITAVGARLAPGPVAVPEHAYGDYAAAAQAHGRALCVSGHEGPVAGQRPTLRWCCDPSSPLGQDAPPPADLGSCATVLDAAYAPLRLQGRSTWAGAARDAVFELISPNKALGLPGVRGAYAIAPRDGCGLGADWADALAAAEPSWPLGAHAVAMLEAWVSDGAQQWLARQRDTLRGWKAELLALLIEAGAVAQPSVTPFVCAQLPPGVTAASLREHDIAVRDTASFGLAGRVRLNALPPDALQALAQAIGALRQPMSTSSTTPPPSTEGNA
ncbi:aminotransferase class I/II-fold pyridoxal phosphate-dependent enzyme [Ideonella sp.]|uniref:aminotransferase class I/II-fold pyridoxal phosphate-dependent enzyme n=1 Tax=Ideonella sp. TaxID=1929293 RepID=UPI0035AE06C4